MKPNAVQVRRVQRTNVITITLSILVLLSFCAGIFIVDPSKRDLQFNIYALIPMGAFIVNALLLVSIIRKGVPSEPRTWFVLYLLNATLCCWWFILASLSPNYNEQLFWSRLMGTGLAMVPVFTYLFALSYTSSTAIRRAFIAPILICVGVLAAALYSTDLIIGSTHEKYPWGYGNQIGPLYAIDLIWIVLPFIFSIIMLLRYRSASQNQLIRKQSLLYALALMIPLVGAGITDGILPAIRIQVPSLSIAFNALTGAAIYYGIRKYQLFQVDPSLLAESVLGTMREAVVVARKDFTVEYTNEEAQNLFGIDPNASDFTTLSSMFPDESWARIKQHLEDGSPLPKEVGKLAAYSITGKTVPVQVVTSKLSEKNAYRAYILVLSDVSTLTASYNDLQDSANRIAELLKQSQLLQKQLADEKANVEHVVEVRTKELREAQEKLKAEDKLKQEFIALSSHNLRTPLSILKWSMELLRAPSNEDMQEQLLKSMESGISHLDSFIKDISTINDLETGGSVEAKPTAINDIIGPLIAETKSYADAKQLEFNINTSDNVMTINANLPWLQNCVRNLLSNALKFTEHGKIGLTTYRDNDRAVIEVSDTGLGIKPAEIPLLFTKFHRGTSYEEYNFEGKGLALYLTKLIVERHNGTITVDSHEGQGSTFKISLPLANVGQPEPLRDE